MSRLLSHNYDKAKIENFEIHRLKPRSWLQSRRTRTQDAERARSNERALCKVVEVKPGFSLRPQDTRNARPMGHLSREAPQREWNYPKTLNHSVGREVALTESSKTFDMWHGATGFGICNVEFQFFLFSSSSSF